MKSKLTSFLLAALIAFCLWAYVITTVSPGSEDTFYNIPVVREGEALLQENGLMITSVSSTSANLTLSGTRQDLAKVNSSNITLKVDVSKIYEPGTHHLRYTINFPGDVSSDAFVVESRYPENITFVVEERLTKEVPVEVEWIGSAPEGYMTDREDRVLDHPMVTVVGPASVADLIEKAVIKVDLTDRRESISESFRYTLCDAAGNGVDSQTIATNVEEIRLEVRIQRFKDIRLVCNVVPGGGASAANATVKLSVDSIPVSGSEAVLDNLGDELVVGTVNLADISRNSTITFPINLPEGVNNISGVTETEATVEFQGLKTRSFTLETFTAVNIPEGMEADIITAELKVDIRGPYAVVQRLAAENILAEVDFTGAEAGSNNFKVVIKFSDASFSQLGAVGNYVVYATLRPVEE